MSATAKGHIALIIAQIIYALNFSFAKGLMPNFISPFALVFSRVVGAAILFWLLSLFVKTEKIDKKDFFKIMLLALFGVVINQVFFLWGLSLSHPINSAIIMVSNPIIVFIFTLIILKEQITILKLSGLSLAIIGSLLLLLFKGNFDFGSETLIGDFMTLINSISWAIFVVLMKPIMQKYNTVTVMRWVFLFGCIYIMPISLKDALNTEWHLFSQQATIAICFVVIATTFFAYLLNIYGLKYLDANKLSMYIYLQPFLATIFAIIMGEDKLTPIKIISGILILTGLYLVNKKTKKVTYD